MRRTRLHLEELEGEISCPSLRPAQIATPMGSISSHSPRQVAADGSGQTIAIIEAP